MGSKKIHVFFCVDFGRTDNSLSGDYVVGYTEKKHVSRISCMMFPITVGLYYWQKPSHYLVIFAVD